MVLSFRSAVRCLSPLVALTLLTIGRGTIALAADNPPAALPAETVQQRDARMAWWRDARFGMFIHWGLYAIPAGHWQGKSIDGIGEWIMDAANIPVADYEKLAAQFNPTQYDPQQWARTAQRGGRQVCRDHQQASRRLLPV